MTKEQKAKEGSSAKRLREIFEVFGHYNLLHGLTPENLRRIFEDLGPTFIKFGQILSMRPDLLSEEYCRELTRLRTDVRPMDFETVVAVLEEEYGQNIRRIFRSLEEQPLGSASIAQVHAAVLHSGRDVVVKVQRPGIYRQMEQDIRLLRRASSLMKLVGRTGNVIDFGAVLDELWAAARQEMDFLAEAEHCKQFMELGQDIKYVAFPHIEWAYTTSKVLCMERIDGIPIDDTEALIKAGYDLGDISQKLVSGYVKQVLDDGFFHADPHPGNIRIRDGKIVWLDLGMVGTLSSHDRELLKKAALAVAANDVYALKNAILGISRHTGKINHSRLSEDIQEMLSRYGSMELHGLDLGQAMKELFTIADGNGLRMPPGISMLSRGVLTLEGVIEKLDPDANVIRLFSSVMSQSLLEDFDLRRALEQGGRLLYAIGSRSAEVSSDLMELARLAARGQSKLNIELTGSEEPLSKISRMVNRLVVCILIAALLVGSSLLCMTDLSPTLFGIPLPGAIGYAIALLLSVCLAVGTLRKKKL